MKNYMGSAHNDRIFKMHGEWYFKTREGIEGPYQDQLQAHRKLDLYLGIFRDLELAERSTPIRSATFMSTGGLLPSLMQWR